MLQWLGNRKDSNFLLSASPSVCCRNLSKSLYALKYLSVQELTWTKETWMRAPTFTDSLCGQSQCRALLGSAHPAALFTYTHHQDFRVPVFFFCCRKPTCFLRLTQTVMKELFSASKHRKGTGGLVCPLSTRVAKQKLNLSLNTRMGQFRLRATIKLWV